MKKVFIILLVVLLSGCSSHSWLTSDSDAFLEYDRVNHRYQIIWTWKLKKGRIRQDTIPILEKGEKIIPSERSSVAAM